MIIESPHSSGISIEDKLQDKKVVDLEFHFKIRQNQEQQGDTKQHPSTSCRGTQQITGYHEKKSQECQKLVIRL